MTLWLTFVIAQFTKLSKTMAGLSLFSDKINLGVMMNVDWFNPLRNYKHSLGDVYLVIINLPRKIRFKRENVILLGLIPGPSEPQYIINSYIKPIIEGRCYFK